MMEQLKGDTTRPIKAIKAIKLCANKLILLDRNCNLNSCSCIKIFRSR